MRFENLQTRGASLRPVQAESREASSDGLNMVSREWECLNEHIDAARTVQPSQEYVSDFARRMSARLDDEQMRRQIIGDYLRATAWRRWMIRGLTTAAMLFLVAHCEIQRRQIETLTSRIQQMEQRVISSVPVVEQIQAYREKERVVLRSTSI